MTERLSVNRRRFLYGSGVALALPWLETFAAESAQPKSASSTPKRFLSVYHPDGVGLPLKEDPAWKDWSWFPHGGELINRDCIAGISVEIVEDLPQDEFLSR